jgi:hypothetical protein
MKGYLIMEKHLLFQKVKILYIDLCIRYFLCVHNKKIYNPLDTELY